MSSSEGTRLVALVSGGIDSPVAVYKMLRVGADVLLLHMDNRPHTDDRCSGKVRKIADRLRDVTDKELPLYIADHGDNQTLIKKRCDNSYQCVLCKRLMMSVAKEFALRNGCSGIVMGDSLGQVASQTLKNIRSGSFDLGFPVIRPLIGLDKLEIEAVAKEIGTYEISILPESPCGVLPQRPITEAEPSKVISLQSQLDFDDMIRTSANSAKRVQ
ncbi:MAG: tRNA 4-thiouridine(8) synthase ThiI [Methanomassiliicoccaceae archaeon]|jgi:thiamine biosynthesis protein ThiI|nr:tRNA 4-thiouridine(8) synthase ThiI [Methanomassiliicoccaceae archaeon]